MLKSTIKSHRHRQEGAALIMVMTLTLLISMFIGGMVYMVTGQKEYNRRSGNYEKSLWVAESAVQRVMSGLKHDNDYMDWDIRTLSERPEDADDNFWFWKWQTVKDEKGKPYGRYWVEILKPTNNAKNMHVKVVAQVYEYLKNGQPTKSVQRAFGVELKQITLGDFAIASNHQIGGARINGGARIYGGVFTAGSLHLDASSTGVFNDYTDLLDSTNFQNYTQPQTTPEAEVFVYKDTVNPAPTDNGMIKLASQAVLGTSDNPMQGIHTAEDDVSVDPGNGTNGTAGDGIIGNGEDNPKGKKDHKLPDVAFPDASAGSQYMTDRQTEAQANSGAVYTGNITLDGSDVTIGTGSPSPLYYDSTSSTLYINGPVYIIGDVSIPNYITYSGKGALFVEGNMNAPGGIEPTDPNGYPKTHAMAFVSTGDMGLGVNSGTSTKYAGTFIGNNSISVQKAKIFGNLFGNTVNLPTNGTRPDIYVHPEVMGEVGVPLPDFVKSEIVKAQWWELSGTAALADPSAIVAEESTP